MSVYLSSQGGQGGGDGGQEAGQQVAGRGQRTVVSPITNYALPLAAGLGLGARRVWSHPAGELRQGQSELL